MDVTKAFSTKMRDIDFLLISGPRGELSTCKLKSHSISSLTWLTSTAMPLRTVEPVETSSLQTTPEQYLIFYSSINNGRLWCPVRRTSVRIFDNLIFSVDDLLINHCYRIASLSMLPFTIFLEPMVLQG